MRTEEIIKFLEDVEKENKNLRKIEISGGEPTIRNDFFEIMDFIKERFPKAILCLLSNGRKFSNLEFTKKCSNYNFYNIIVAIHGPNKKIHEKITNAENSFWETVNGVKNMLAMEMNIKTKTIITKINYKFLPRIAEFVAVNFEGIKNHAFHGLDICGNAEKNFEKVAVSLKKAKPMIEEAIDILKSYGVSTGLYSIPYCCVDEAYWKFVLPQPKTTFFYKSPEREVVNEFLDEKYGIQQRCFNCSLKHMCSGVWESYYKKFQDDLSPISLR